MFCSYFCSLLIFSSSSPFTLLQRRNSRLFNASIFDPRSVGNVRGTFCIIFSFLLLFSLHSN
jgi:hypothetical protein